MVLCWHQVLNNLHEVCINLPFLGPGQHSEAQGSEPLLHPLMLTIPEQCYKDLF